MISFKQLQIGHKQALASVEIEMLKKGEMVALIGSNGSGKTTLLKTIAGQLAPINGTIDYDGKSITSLEKKELARLIAFVPARFPETDFLTVRDFIGLGRTPFLNQFGTMKTEDEKVVSKIIDRLGILHLADKNTSDLSDGERQLCSVARALAQETPILLLDEPTGYLDYKNKRRLLSILAEVTAELNLITLFSTHDLETIKSLKINLVGVHATKKNEGQIPLIVPIVVNLPLDEIVDEFYR